MTPELRELVEKWNEKNKKDLDYTDRMYDTKWKHYGCVTYIPEDNNIFHIEITWCDGTESDYDASKDIYIPTEREVMEELKKKCGDDFEVTPHEGGWLAYYDPDLREPIKDATDPDLLTCLLKLWAEVVK